MGIEELPEGLREGDSRHIVLLKLKMLVRSSFNFMSG